MSFTTPPNLAPIKETQTSSTASPTPPRGHSKASNSALAQSSNDSAAETSAAASELGSAIDEFLGDLERKFRSIGDEILGKLDDMAARCDRIEAELLMHEQAQLASPSKGGTQSDSGSA